MQNVNKLKTGAVISYASMILSYVISIAYTPIMIRILGQSEFGLYNLVSSIVGYLGLLSFGFGSSYMRYYSRYKAKNDEYNITVLNGMFLIVFSIIGIIALIAGFVMVFNIELFIGKNLTSDELSIAKVLLAIMVINIALSFPFSIFNSYVIANEEYIFQKSLQMVKTLVNPFIMLPVLLMGHGSIGMVVVTTFITVIVEICNMIYCIRKLKIQFHFHNFHFGLMREIAVFSIYIFMNMIIDQINWNVDKIIVGRYNGTVGVAVYGIAAQLNTYYMTLSSTISNMFIPRVNRIVATNNDSRELTLLFTKIGRIQFMLLALVSSGLIFFGRPFILMWAGPSYVDAYPMTLLLIIPVTIPLIQNIGIEIQKAKNMHQFRSWVYLIIAIGNVLLSIPLTKKFGGVGAAMGTSISLFIGNGLVMNWHYQNNIGIDIKYFWRQIMKFIPSLLLPFFAGTFIALYINLYIIHNFIIYGLLYLLMFCLSNWFIGMNKFEKELIGKPINRAFSKIRLHMVKRLIKEK